MDTPAIDFDESLCTRCGRCVRDCPPRILVASSDKPPHLDLALAGECLACGHCVAICPEGAVRHSALTADGFDEPQPSPEPAALLALFRARRSVRHYKNKPVERSVIESLLEAVRYAPTGKNAREVSAIVLHGRERVAELQRSLVKFYTRLFRVLEKPLALPVARVFFNREQTAELSAMIPQMRRIEERLRLGEDPLFHHAPALIILHAPRSAETGEVDTALAAAQLSLLAHASGLGTCYIGYATAALKRIGPLARRAEVPRGHLAHVVLTLGYPSESYKRLVWRPGVEARWL